VAAEPVHGAEPEQNGGARTDRRRRRLKLGIEEGRKEGKHAEREEARGRNRRSPRSENAEDGAEGEGCSNDEQLERELVVLPEERDDELLRTGRLKIDHRRPNRGHERREAGNDPGGKLAGTDRDRGTDRTGHRVTARRSRPGRGA
jgi:hypothetical protein